MHEFKRSWGTMRYTATEGPGPVLLFVHGSGCDSTDWNGILPSLPANARIVVDLPGHGTSDTPSCDVTISSFAADLIDLVDHVAPSLGIPAGSPFILIGHSLGGMIGLRMLESRPERLTGLALVEGWTRLGVPWKPAADLFGTLSADTVDRLRTRTRDTSARWPDGRHDRFWKTVRAANAWDVLNRAETPILEIYGDRGEALPSAPDALHVPDRPNIDLRWIAGTSHFLMYEKPDELGRTIADWLTREAFAA